MLHDVGGLPSVRLQYNNTTCAVIRGNGERGFFVWGSWLSG